MKLLFFGDIVGRPGRQAVVETLPQWREQYKPDLIIANAENAANGQLPQPKHLDQLQAAGVEAFTVGDHIRDRDFAPLADYPIVRPYNLSKLTPGVGLRLVETSLHRKMALISLVGHAFLKIDSRNYFSAAEEVVTAAEAAKPDAIFVDFHAEATSEKNALGFALDGRVSAVVGTHTHVPTADTKLLPHGTAYQTDVGMCGGYHSVLGFSPSSARQWLGRELGEADGRVPFEMEEQSRAICDAVLVETDGPHRAKKITRISSRP